MSNGINCITWIRNAVVIGIVVNVTITVKKENIIYKHIKQYGVQYGTLWYTFGHSAPCAPNIAQLYPLMAIIQVTSKQPTGIKCTPYAANFAMSKPCGKLSKALLRSTAIVPPILPLSIDCFQSSIIFNNMVWQLNIGLKPDRNFENIDSKYDDSCTPDTFSNTFDKAVRTLTGL